MEKEKVRKLIMYNRRRLQHDNMVIIDMGLLHKMINLSGREMSKTILAIITLTSAQLLSVFANAYADDTQNSDTDKVTNQGNK
jgi:1,4-dihydroxy-2-naphthoate octaprenyltransferase